MFLNVGNKIAHYGVRSMWKVDVSPFFSSLLYSSLSRTHSMGLNAYIGIL